MPAGKDNTGFGRMLDGYVGSDEGRLVYIKMSGDLK